MTPAQTAQLREIAAACRALASRLEAGASAIIFGDTSSYERARVEAERLLPGVEQVARSAGWEEERAMLDAAREDWQAANENDDAVRAYDAFCFAGDACLRVARGCEMISAGKTNQE